MGKVIEPSLVLRTNEFIVASSMVPFIMCSMGVPSTEDGLSDTADSAAWDSVLPEAVSPLAGSEEPAELSSPETVSLAVWEDEASEEAEEELDVVLLLQAASIAIIPQARRTATIFFSCFVMLTTSFRRNTHAAQMLFST